MTSFDDFVTLVASIEDSDEEVEELLKSAVANFEIKTDMSKKKIAEAILACEKLDDLASKEQLIEIEIHTKKLLSDLYYHQEKYKAAYRKYDEYITVYEECAKKRAMTPKDEEAQLRRELEKAQDSLMLRLIELKRKNTLMDVYSKNQEFVQRIGAQLTSISKPKEIYETLTNECAKQFFHTNLAVALIEDDKIMVEYAIISDGTVFEREHSFPINDGYNVMAYCVRNNCDVKIESVEDYDKYCNKRQDAAEKGKDVNNFNKSAIYVRLIAEGHLIGVLTIQQKDADKYTESDFEAMKSVASFVSASINNARKIELIQKKSEELESLSLKDPLTGLSNRRAFNLHTNYYAENKVEFVMIFADMNHLKKINDNLGHTVGDDYLKKIADILVTSVPDGAVYRLSGDEFAVLVERKNREEIYQIVQTIQSKCKTTEGEYPFSVAVGCAFSGGDSVDAIFTKAETRMYQDKEDYYRRYKGNTIERNRKERL